MKAHRVFTLVLIVTQVLMMLSYSTVRAEDWQMFRHDPEHLGFTASIGPINTPVVLWRFQALSDIASSPAVVNGRVFITDYTGDLYCLNASTGDQVWASRATDSPAVFGDIVYAGHNVITAFNGSSGEKIWSDQSIYGYGGISPAVANGAVFTAFDGCYAYNASTGVRLWNFTTGDVISPPAVSEGIVYFGFGYGVLALNSSTGDRIWEFTPDYQGLPLYEQSSPSISGNRVYVGLADGLYCLNAKTGSKIWNNTLGASATSPAIGNGIVYFGSAYGPNVYALNASTGARIWNYTTGYLVKSSPAVTDDAVYIGSSDGNLYAFSCTTGAELWNFTLQPLLDEKGQDRYLYASPAVANGVIYMGSSDGIVYALGEKPSGIINPSPYVPEFSSLTILSILLTIPIALITIRKRITKKLLDTNNSTSGIK